MLYFLGPWTTQAEYSVPESFLRGGNNQRVLEAGQLVSKRVALLRELSAVAEASPLGLVSLLDLHIVRR